MITKRANELWNRTEAILFVLMHRIFPVDLVRKTRLVKYRLKRFFVCLHFCYEKFSRSRKIEWSIYNNGGGGSRGLISGVLCKKRGGDIKAAANHNQEFIL